MTESEAKSKRCCGPEGCGYAAQVHPDVMATEIMRYCVGSDCLAWRTRPIQKKTTSGIVTVQDSYCGLAGKP
jgi:hypothetical protein